VRKLGYTLVKNALANVVRGGATAVVALVLPHFLTQSLDRDRFACWALMLQIAAYASYLDFGLQTAVARYLAQAIERGDNGARDRLVSTAVALLTIAGVVAFLVIAVIVWQLPAIFSHVPGYLLADMRRGILVLAANAAILLPLSTFTGVLIGLHRNEYPAIAIGVSRIVGGLGVVAASRSTSSLFWLAACMAVPSVVGGLAQLILSLRLLPGLRLAMLNVSRSMAVELARYCSVLTLFSFWMLLITGLDVTIVGYFKFSAVGYYSVASTLVAFFSGLNTAVFNAFISPVAVLHARAEYPRIAGLIMRATRLNTVANLTILAMAAAFGIPLLQLWIGQSYARDAFPIVLVLLFGQAVRLTASAYASSLLAMGEQRYAVLPGAVEAFSNLVFSLIGIHYLGPIGVAWGTLAGAVLGLSCYLFYTFGKVASLSLSISLYLRRGVAIPALTFAPVLLITALLYRAPVLDARFVIGWVMSLGLSIMVFLQADRASRQLPNSAIQAD
jgi:O-antigen/teichoic acid export membrane protein